MKAEYYNIWGDWSAERGDEIDGFAGPEVNVFELHDGLLDGTIGDIRLVTIEKGNLGMAPAAIELDNDVCNLFGAQMPILL